MSAAAAAAGDLTLAAALRGALRLHADRVALVGSGVVRTYRELDERASRLAQAWLAAGIGPGDRVAVLSVPRPEYAEAYVAASRIGVTIVALNTRLHPDELAHCAGLGTPRMCLCSPDLVATAHGPGLGRAVLGDVVPFGAAYEAMLAGAAADEPDVEVRGDAIHNVLFTSGTTGLPKGAMISQRAAAVRGFRVADFYRLTPDDGFIGWLPMFHCGGDEPLYATLLSGGRYATFERADPAAMFPVIARERLTWSLFLPGVITTFLEHPDRARHDLSSLRFGIGYANMMPQVVRAFTAALDCDFWDAFGQTESSFLLAHGRSGPGEDPSLRKRPTPLLDVRVVDGDLREQPAGTPGECVVRGPSVMSGYLGDEAASAAAFAGGWLHTGDVLVRHEDGTLAFVDRTKYLIKTGGENVYPAEVEQVLARHPGVGEACVLGVADPHWGETVKAVVVRRPGADVDAGELVAWCRARLSGYKRPRLLEFVTADEVPRSTTGKVLRHELARRPLDPAQHV